MTQEEAIIKAIEEYGGKASNKQIYERAKMYAQFGGNTPDATIRWWLQKSKLIKPSVGERGWWELLSYQEEIARLKADNAKLTHDCEVKNNLIIYMKSEAYQIFIISGWMKRYMDTCKNKSQSVRESIQKFIADIATRLNFKYSDDTQEVLNRFDDDKPPVISLIKKEYRDNATSTDIDIPGITPQELREFFDTQNHKLINKNTSTDTKKLDK